MIALLVRQRRLSLRIGAIEKRIAEGAGTQTERPITPARVPVPTAYPEPVAISGSPATDIHSRSTSPSTDHPAEISTKAAPSSPVTPSPSAEPASPAEPTLLKRIETQFAQNWTGILGAIIMVMGVSFLGIYAALALSAVYRFIMIVAVAAGLFGVFLFLRSKSKWLELATWLRSSAGAIFLFGCLGSGAIPGLAWIDDQRAALALLVLGIAVNLYLGYAGKTQVFASLHVLLSLIALGIAPQSQTTLICASVIALLSVVLTYRARRDYHLLVTVSGFFFFHLHWYNFSGLVVDGALPFALRVTGIASITIIGLGAACVHYRRLYQTTRFDIAPFITHLANWIFLGASALQYSTGSKWNTIVLAVASVSAFVLARHARRLHIPWLHATDTLISLSLAVFAAFTLQRWGVDALPIAGIIYLETMIFHVIAVREDTGLLRNISTAIRHLACAGAIVAALVLMEGADPAGFVKTASIIGALMLVETVFHVYALRSGIARFDSIAAYGTREPETAFGMSGIVIAVLGIVFLGYAYTHAWAPYAMAAFAIICLVLRQRIQSDSLGVGLLILIPAAHMFSWFQIFANPTLGFSDVLLLAGPYLPVTIAAVALSRIDARDRFLVWPGLYLLVAHALAIIVVLFKPVSPYIPTIFLLVGSAACLEIARFFNERQYTLSTKGGIDRYLLQIGYLLVAIFLVAHLTVNLQLEDYLGPVRVRILIEAFALVVILFWATSPRHAIDYGYKSWRYLHPLMWELAICFSVVIILAEVPPAWLPPVWSAVSIILFAIGRKFESLSRFQFHSTLFHWIASFWIAFLASTPVPSLRWQDQGWVAGVAAVVLQFGYVIFFYRRAALSDVSFPIGLAPFARLAERVHRRQNPWLYYPFFASIALFAYWSFDASVRTILWAAESFAIFTVSLIVKENHFRIVSMIGLGACLIRLVAFDLAQSGTLMRAVVFLVVGVIMIAMNALYNKYRDRF